MKSLITRLLGFSALPFISALTPLLLLPIVARIGGPDGWASVALGQAVGAIGSVAIGYGSMIWGPASVAVARSDAERRSIYANVSSSKALISCAALPAVIVISGLMSPPTYVFEGIGMAISMAMFGWSPSWYLIGLGRPRPIATYETIPKLMATAISAVLLVATGALWIYPLCLIVATLSGLAVFHRKYFGHFISMIRPFRKTTLKSLRTRSNTALIDAMGAAYVASPIPVASAGATTTEISAVASGDKLYRYGLFAVVALGNTFQGWVLEASPANKLRRHTVAILAHLILGVSGFAFLLVAGPWATTVLFGPDVAAGNPLLGFYGIAYLAVSTSTPLVRNILIPAGKTRLVLAATVVGALTGLPSMALFNAAVGPPGVALGLAISEFLVLVITLAAAFPHLARIARERPRLNARPSDSSVPLGQIIE